jgi:hypothetical protein
MAVLAAMGVGLHGSPLANELPGSGSDAANGRGLFPFPAQRCIAQPGMRLG